MSYFYNFYSCMLCFNVQTNTVLRDYSIQKLKVICVKVRNDGSHYQLCESSCGTNYNISNASELYASFYDEYTSKIARIFWYG